MLKTPNTLYKLDLQLSRNFKPFWSSRNFLAIFLLRAVILQEKSRWAPLTVDCEEAHCERSCVSGTRKCRATVALKTESSFLDTGSNSPER